MDRTIKYFKYHLVRNCIALPIMILLTLLYVGSTVVYTSWYYGSGTVYLSLGNCYPLLFFFSIGITLIELYAFNNRRNLDLWYSFPIDRRSLLGVHYLSGLIQVLVAALVTVAEIYFAIAAHSDQLRPEKLSLFSPQIVLMAIGVYSLTFFAFSQANNGFDGCVFIFAYLNIPYFMASSVEGFYFAVTKAHSPEYSAGRYTYIFETMSNISYYATEKIYKNKDMAGWYRDIPSGEYIAIALLAVIGVALSLLAIYLVKNRDASKVGGSSDSWFGYKTLIPIAGIAYVLDAGDIGYGGIIIFAVLLFVAYTMFRRSVKFKKYDYIICIALLVLYALIVLFTDIFDWGVVYSWDW